MVVTRGKSRWEEVVKGKGVEYMVTEGNLTLDGKHTMQYTCAVLQNSILETHIILLTNVTPKM